jgi:hypothetical protein
LLRVIPIAQLDRMRKTLKHEGGRDRAYDLKKVRSAHDAVAT